MENSSDSRKPAQPTDAAADAQHNVKGNWDAESTEALMRYRAQIDAILHYRLLGDPSRGISFPNAAAVVGTDNAQSAL